MDFSVLRQRRVLLAGAGLLLVVLAFVFFSGGGGETREAIIVSPERGPFDVTVTATGELRAQNSTEIRGPAGAQQARIFRMSIERLVPEGTVVEQGDFVAEIDRSELTSGLKDAQDGLRAAQSDYEQARLDTSMTLSEARDNLVNLRYSMEEAQLEMERSQYEAPAVKRQAEIDHEKSGRAYQQATKSYDTKVAQARAQVMKARTALSKAQREMQNLQTIAGQFTIHAPQNGMVIYRRDRSGKVEEGDQISAWDPVVATLPDLSSMESVTYVNEVDIQKVRKGQPVRVGLDAAPGKQLAGTVSQVANVGEQRPGSTAKFFEVIVAVAEQDTTLRPGMTTSNTVVVEEVPQALHIPLEAVHARGDSLSYVFLAGSGRPTRQQVELGLIGEDRAVVERGVEASDDLYLTVPADTSGLSWRHLGARPEGGRPAGTSPAEASPGEDAAAATRAGPGSSPQVARRNGSRGAAP